MKNLALSLILILSYFIGYSQDAPDRNALYQFIQPTKLDRCDMLGELLTPKLQEVFLSGYDFEIVGIKQNGDIIIDIVYFDNNDARNTQYRGNTDKSTPSFFFLIPSTIFKLVSEKEISKWSFSFGTASTLLKYRPGSDRLLQGKYPINSDIGNDFSLAALLGLQLSVNNTLNEYFLFGINYTSIKMTPQTTQGTLTSDTNVGALSPTLAFVFEYNKVQLGLFSGLDMPTGDAGKTWVYKGRPWFGIGVGFSIFKQGSGSSNAKQTTKE